jgi:hypothetical protein
MVKQIAIGDAPYSEGKSNELINRSRGAVGRPAYRTVKRTGKLDRLHYAPAPMPTPKTTPQQGVNYLSLDAMTTYEREVFDLALAALAHPLPAREAWFVYAAKQMKRATELLGL